MPKCKYCGKSGLFLVVSNNNLCRNCDSFVVADIQNRLRIHNDSIRLIENSENPDVVYSRIGLAIKNLSGLLEYEKKGIDTINPIPSKLLEVFKTESNNFFFDCFNRAYKSLSIKILNLKSNSAIRNQILKFINKIDEYIPKFEDYQPLNKIKVDCERELLSYLSESKKTKELSDNSLPQLISSFDNPINIKEIHPAKLLYIEDNLDDNEGMGGIFNATFNLGTSSQNEFIGQDEPSKIYKNLPILKPKELNLVEPPPYFPTFIRLSAEQRWIYLDWLKDISEKINIGYVFLYYYGLERNLLMGDFETAFQEILFLRNIHISKSFESYSYNALLFSSALQKKLDKAQFVIENESRNGIGNVDLLFSFRFEKDISVADFMSLAKKIKGVNLRYIKDATDRYKTALSIILSEKFGIAGYPIYSLYRIEEIPRNQTLAFANTSFPSSMRFPILPNFLDHKSFNVECSEIFKNAHELVKQDLKRERLIND